MFNRPCGFGKKEWIVDDYAKPGQITMIVTGIEMEKALDYLKSKSLPTSFNEDKVERAVYNAYERNKHLFGSERSNYRSYNEYKSRY